MTTDNSDNFYFWGHSGEYACLSNWSATPFEKDSLLFLTSEHYMMYEKAMLMNDARTAIKILNAFSPKEAKRLGRTVKNWDESKWVEHRERIMYEGCMAKFQSNPDIKKTLLSTYPKHLVEASPFDSIWGIGMKATHKDVEDKSKWGLNLLGKTLDRVRATLMK